VLTGQTADSLQVRQSVAEVLGSPRKDGETVTTNWSEGFWAWLKRQIGGRHHSESRRHLHRHLSEAKFRSNNRTLVGRRPQSETDSGVYGAAGVVAPDPRLRSHDGRFLHGQNACPGTTSAGS
jgi:hypothetical protein